EERSAKRRGDRDAPRGQGAPALEDDVPGLHVASGATDVLSGGDRRKETHALAVALGELVRNDGLHPARDRSAGEDADRRSRLEHDARARVARHHLSREPKRGRRALARRGEVRGDDAVAVHRGVVEGRHRIARRDVLAEHAAMGSLERHHLFDGRADHREDAIAHGLDRLEILTELAYRHVSVPRVSSAIQSRYGACPESIAKPTKRWWR